MKLDVIDRPVVETTTRVAVLDRRRLAADGVAAMLARHAGVRLVGIESTMRAAVRLLSASQVDVVVFGVEASRVLSTARLLQRISDVVLRAVPRWVAIVSGDPHLADVIGGPSVTVLTSSMSEESLRDVVVGARDRRILTIPAQVIWPRSVKQVPIDQMREALTAREHEVLRGIGAGLSTSEIAARLGISPNTVRTHAQRLMSKLSVHSRVQAAAIAADLENLLRVGS